MIFVYFDDGLFPLYNIILLLLKFCSNDFDVLDINYVIYFSVVLTVQSSICLLQKFVV